MSRSRNRGSNPVKTEENAVVKAAEVGSKKIKYAFHISPECMKAINEMYKKDGSTTRNEFIENAVNFYIDYLKGGTMTNYLGSAECEIKDDDVLPEPEMNAERKSDFIGRVYSIHGR